MYSGCCGPGTLVVTVLTLRWATRVANRIPMASSMGGANPDSDVNASPATASFDSFSPAIWRVMARSRSAGSSIPTGSAANIADTLFCNVPSPTAMAPGSRARTDTGTSVRTTRSTDSPRERSNSRKPLVIDASTTSLKAPPSPLRTRLMSSTVVAAHA